MTKIKPKRQRQTVTRKFKKGDVRSLDSIYDISGLYTSDWWEPVNDSDSNGSVREYHEATHASGEVVRITRDITITITRTFGPNEL